MNPTPIHMRWHVSECIIPGIIALALVACLPLIGMVAFALRGFIVGGVLLVIVVAVGRCLLYPRLWECWKTALAPETDYQGMRLVHDVAIDRGHCWAWWDGLDNQVVVGADDIVQATLGPVDEVSLPHVGRRVERGEPLFRLRHAGRSIELPSPVSGAVVASNQVLREHPDSINSNPFSGGWIVRISAENLQEERRHLLIGRRALRWFRREVDMLLRLLPPIPPVIPSIGPGVGGMQGARLDLRIDDSAWEFLKRALVSGGTRR